MFPDCIDRFGHQKRETKNNNKQTKEKQRKSKQIKNGKNSTYYEPLSEE